MSTPMIDAYYLQDGTRFEHRPLDREPVVYTLVEHLDAECLLVLRDGAERPEEFRTTYVRPL